MKYFWSMHMQFSRSYREVTANRYWGIFVKSSLIYGKRQFNLISGNNFQMKLFFPNTFIIQNFGEPKEVTACMLIRELVLRRTQHQNYFLKCKTHLYWPYLSRKTNYSSRANYSTGLDKNGTHHKGFNLCAYALSKNEMHHTPFFPDHLPGKTLYFLTGPSANLIWLLIYI